MSEEPSHHHHHHSHEEKEKRRKKQVKRMEKLLAKVWELDEKTASFQQSKHKYVKGGTIYCLTHIGLKLDEGDSYRLGRHGWEDFARDLKSVYHRHLQRQTKRAVLAKEQFDKVKELLAAKDESLAKIASEYVPPDASPQQHDAVANNDSTPSKKRNNSVLGETLSNGRRDSKRAHTTSSNGNLAEREERAMEQLKNFIEEKGGSREQVSGYRARVTRKPSNNRFDVNYFNEVGRRFRSMLEVGRFLHLVNDGGVGSAVRTSAVRRKKPSSSKEQEAEKKKLRKELERLRKAHQRAVKSLEDVTTTTADKEPGSAGMGEEEDDDDPLSGGEGGGDTKCRALATCAAARVPDISGFPGIPQTCVPDTVLSWDFLCTFQRALSLSPIGLDDFANALSYSLPEGRVLGAGGSGDDVSLAPPVYLAEAHLGLLKLLLQDRSGNDWWWSTIETDDSELLKPGGATNPFGDVDEEDAAGKKDDDEDTGTAPVIRVDMATLLAQVEEPVVTATWLQPLEGLGGKEDDAASIKGACKAAMKATHNRWVVAYLKKALEGYKTLGAQFARRAVLWLVDRVQKARPDLSRSVNQDSVSKARAQIVEKADKEMESLPETAPTVTDEDVVSEDEEDEDDSDDEDSDEERGQAASTPKEAKDDSERPASVIPPKPLPSLVDMLLPPSKPSHNSEFVNPFTWPQMVGATAARVLHRKKRVWNEIDDSLRAARELPPLTIAERRQREDLTACRVLIECAEPQTQEEKSPMEKAIGHLTSGGYYLHLDVVERLCILRLLIEAAYDTDRLYFVVDGNYKQRTSAVKALDVEQRRAKKEAKEKAASDERAARERLAADEREYFLDEKREEIRKLNEKSKEFADDVIESLTDEDILEFDEDIKADYEALPGPESYSKTDVNRMVEKMREQAAFETDALRVLNMGALLEREKRQLEEMEGQLSGFGGEAALDDPTLDRETSRSLERLCRDIEKARRFAETLPEQRAKAMEQLRDAIEDGTIKVLRSALATAKKAKLTGPDEETGGVWAVDVMRDAALELENAKQNKRVADAQKDLLAKRNKCFIRSEPIGLDRFGNRFWSLDNSEAGYVWVETEYSVSNTGDDADDSGSTAKPPPGFLNLALDARSISVGAPDMEEDLIGKDDLEGDDSGFFRLFSRREYHTAGFAPTMAKYHWGCHATEESLRAMIKNLDGRVARERELKTTLKGAVEDTVGTAEEKQDNPKGDADDPPQDQSQPEASGILNAGDEAAFLEAKQASEGGEDYASEILDALSSAIGQPVRVRIDVQDSKDGSLARYECGTVTGWTTRRETIEIPKENEDSEEEFEDEDEPPQTKVVDVPIWRVSTDRGHVVNLTGPNLIGSLSRHDKWKHSRGYFENDSVFIAYRNTLGRHCGRAADAPYAASANNFARQMVKKEGDLYAKLKVRSYDNNWGGKSGARALWTNSMKDYAFDIPTAKQGLLTLENALFELTGEFEGYENLGSEAPDAKTLLSDPALRVDIELESIEKNLPGLWNSPASRAVYIEIVTSCETTGFLALALDLLCRNTTKYLQTHKLLKARGAGSVSPSSSHAATSTRSTRRMNAWQQANQDW